MIILLEISPKILRKFQGNPSRSFLTNPTRSFAREVLPGIPLGVPPKILFNSGFFQICQLSFLCMYQWVLLYQFHCEFLHVFLRALFQVFTGNPTRCSNGNSSRSSLMNFTRSSSETLPKVFFLDLFQDSTRKFVKSSSRSFLDFPLVVLLKVLLNSFSTRKIIQDFF